MLRILEILAVLRDLAVIAGVGFGIKLYSALLVAKKAEAELLRSRVDHLEKISAPALVDQLEKMAPLLNRYASEIEELKKKLHESPAIMIETTRRASAIGTGSGMLDAVIAVKDFIHREAARAGLSGESFPSHLQELNELINDDLMPLAGQALDGKVPELRHLKNAITKAQRASLTPRAE